MEVYSIFIPINILTDSNTRYACYKITGYDNTIIPPLEIDQFYHICTTIGKTLKVESKTLVLHAER